jgi:hypothetical protein
MYKTDLMFYFIILQLVAVSSSVKGHPCKHDLNVFFIHSSSSKLKSRNVYVQNTNTQNAHTVKQRFHVLNCYMS